MRKLQFPKPFAHAHPPVRNVNDIEVERLNRLAARERLEAHNDFEINRKAEKEVRAGRGAREDRRGLSAVANGTAKA